MSRSQKKAKRDDIVVFEILRDSACAECGEELGKGRWLRLEHGRPLCLSCADLAHLTFLPAGDTALTRRASRYSALRAVLVRFSRARGRYERQGILVEEEALARAEHECLADANARARSRERRAERDALVDARYQSEFARHIRDRYPGCPEPESIAIAEHACRKYSGRVGRSADAKRFDSETIALAVHAHEVNAPPDWARSPLAATRRGRVLVRRVALDFRSGAIVNATSERREVFEVTREGFAAVDGLKA
jgi:hypothetical protein